MKRPSPCFDLLCLTEQQLTLISTQSVLAEACDLAQKNDAQAVIRIEPDELSSRDLVDLRELTQTESGVKSSLVKFRLSAKGRYMTLLIRETAINLDVLNHQVSVY